MKLLVNSRPFAACIAYAEDRAKFAAYFSGSRSFDTMPLLRVTLPEAKTLTQLGTVWKDFTIVGELLHIEPSMVYLQCLRAEQLNDVWLQERDGVWHFSTLSGLTKEQTSAAIPMIRDYLQQVVNDAHGEWINIRWACKENVKETGDVIRQE